MQLLQEDMLNPIVSGGLTGALLAVRSGPMVCIFKSSKAILRVSFILDQDHFLYSLTSKV